MLAATMVAFIVVAGATGSSSQNAAPQCAGGTATTAPAIATPVAATGDLASFLAAVRTHESGGNYQARSKVSDASGAYQFISTTWHSEAKAAGQATFAGGAAWQAPPDIQDAVAGFMATNAFNGPAHGDWGGVASIWYVGFVATGAALDYAPAGNGGLTPRKYESQIAALMAAQATTPPAGGDVADPAPDPSAECVASAGTTVLVSLNTPGSVAAMFVYAAAQIGKPYLWGGTGPDGYDCSGLVMRAYEAAGLQLPRVASAQYDATKQFTVPYSAAQPGDLLFWSFDGRGSDAHHIAIYLGGGQMLDAPHTGAQVRIEKVWMTSDFLPIATEPSMMIGVTP